MLMAIVIPFLMITKDIIIEIVLLISNSVKQDAVQMPYKFKIKTPHSIL